MEPLKIKGVAHKGVLSVKVPKEFDDRELEVTIHSISTSEGANKNQEMNKERVKRLLGIFGSAKFPDFPITKYDVYEQ